MTATAASELGKADWSVLRHFELSDNHLDALALRHVSTIPLPALCEVEVDRCKHRYKGLLLD